MNSVKPGVAYRLMTILAVFSLLAAIHSVPAAGAVQFTCPLNVTPRDPGWTSIKAPDFTENPAIQTVGISHYAVWPGDANRVLAAGGDEVFSTSDGGCHWKRIFPGPLTSTPSPDCWWAGLAETALAPCPQITDVDIAASGGAGRIYLQASAARVSSGGTATIPATFIFVSDDGGSTWQTTSPGGPNAVAAATGDLLVAPSDPRTIYVTRALVTPNYAVFVSHDGGSTWDSHPLPGITPDAVMTTKPSIEVSPTNPKELWAATQVIANASFRIQLFHSIDEAATWTVVPTPVAESTDTDVTSLDVAQRPGQPARVALSSKSAIYASLDEGRSWLPSLSLPDVRQVEFGKGGDYLFAVANPESVVRMDLVRRTAIVIKNRTFDEAEDQDFSGFIPDSYVPGAGYYLLGGRCSWVCRDIYRYSGRGT